MRHIAFLLVLVASIQTAGGGTTHTEEVYDQLDVIEPVPGFGICTHLAWSHRGWDAQELIPVMKRLGVSVVRDGIPWAKSEQKQGQYKLPPEHEAWIEAVLKADLKIIFMLGYDNPIYEDPLDAEAYGRFAAWFAERFKDEPGVLAIEVWNEPNNFRFRQTYGGKWNGLNDAEWIGAFAEFAQVAVAAIKEVDPDRTVITSAGSPPATLHMFNRFPDAYDNVDGVTVHPYSYRLPPESVPWGGETINTRDGIQTAGDDHTIRSMWQVFSDTMKAKLGRDIPIWVTEVGFSTFNDTREPGLFAGYNENAQAAYHVRAAVAALANPQIAAWCIYDLMNDGTDIYSREANFGLVHHSRDGLKPKPSFFALRRMAEMLGGEYAPIKSPPAALMVEAVSFNPGDAWQRWPEDPMVGDKGPHVYWFKTSEGYVTFLWKGGRLDAEGNPPVGGLAPVTASASVTVSVVDLVTGNLIRTIEAAAGETMLVDELSIDGNPIVIQWKTRGTLDE